MLSSRGGVSAALHTDEHHDWLHRGTPYPIKRTLGVRLVEIMESTSLLPERIKFAIAPGGRTSAFWWLAGKIARLETHQVFSRRLAPLVDAMPRNEECGLFRSIRSDSDVMMLEPVIREQLEAHLAKGLHGLASEESAVFFLSKDRIVLSQLLIRRGPRILLDSPSGIELEIGADRDFLSYLYTPQEHRRTGAARRLLELVCVELQRERRASLIAHVRATNVPSLNAFRTGGWQQIGTLWSRAEGDWIAAVKLRAHGIVARRAVDSARR